MNDRAEMGMKWEFLVRKKTKTPSLFLNRFGIPKAYLPQEPRQIPRSFIPALREMEKPHIRFSASAAAASVSILHDLLQ